MINPAETPPDAHTPDLTITLISNGSHKNARGNMADRLNQQRPKSRWPKVLAWFSVLALVAARPAGPGAS